MKRPIYDQPQKGIIACQYLSTTLVRLYLFLSGSKVEQAKVWVPDPSLHYVLASNHLSWFDPFAITSAIDWKRFRKLLPYRYISTPKFLRHPVLGPFMVPLGCYPSHEFKNYPYGLDASINLLKQGNTIVIFPQGKRTLDKTHAVKRGVAELAKQPGTRIIPVLIQKKPSLMLPAFTIRLGAPVDASALSPEEIMELIYDLEHQTHGTL